jgi:phosphate-selective porin OprO and OprP
MRARAAFFVTSIAIGSIALAGELPSAIPVSAEWGGLLQVQGEAGDPGDSRIDGGDRIYLRRARLNATATFPEHFVARLELELAGSLSKASSLRAQVTDGYIEWNRYGALTVRAGQFKTPFGYEQLYADARLPTIERSLGNDRLTVGRQLGLDVLGSVGPLNYSAGFFNGTGTNNNFNDNGNYLYAGRIAATLPGGISTGAGEVTGAIGVDGMSSKDQSVALASDFALDSTPETSALDAVFSGRRYAVGVDGQVRVGPFELWAEYLRETFEPKDRVPASRFRSEGWYAQGTWFALPKRLQVVVKYDTFDPDRLLRSSDTRTWTAGLNYFVRGDNLKLQVDYLRTRLPSGETQNKALGRVQALF